MPSLIYTFNNAACHVRLKDRNAIGRADYSDIVVADPSLSRHHASILKEAGFFIIKDEGSRNGIVIDGEHVTLSKLEDGARFRLGDVEFVFSLAEPPEAEPALKPEAAPEPTPDAPRDVVPAPPASVAPEPAPAPVPTPPAAEVPKPGVAPAPAEAVAAAPPALAALPAVALESHEQAIAQLNEARAQILSETGKVIVGQREVLNQILVALFARGHCLMIGVPGLAKTLMVKAIGSAVDLDTKRIQFTPDLMPSDITGTEILEEDPQTGKRTFRFHKGPLFTNLLLADEINRTPPKTQAALLEAMQEGRVTAGGATYLLDQPFFVLATQNPIEQEGTYPLPEAQLDRFMFMVKITYPAREEEMEIYRATTSDVEHSLQAVLTADDILRMQRLVRRVPVSDHVIAYMADLVRATRPDAPDAPDFVKEWLTWGAGPRAGQYLLLSAKARAILMGRMNVSCEDVRAAAHPVLRHRIFCNFNATSQGVDSDKVVAELLNKVPQPSEKDYRA